MSTRKVDPIPIAIGGVALVFGIGVSVYVLVFSGPTDAASSDDLTEVDDQDEEPEPDDPVVDEPVVQRIVAQPVVEPPVVPDVDPMPTEFDDLADLRPGFGGGEVTRVASSGGRSGWRLYGLLPHVPPELLWWMLRTSREDRMPPPPIPRGKRFEEVPGSEIEERWLAAEGEIPPAALVHLERAEKVIRAIQTPEKKALASLDTVYAQRMRQGLRGRAKEALKNNYKKLSDPLKDDIRDWSLEELRRPQPLDSRDLRVGRVGTLPTMTVLLLPDEETAYVQLDEVPSLDVGSGDEDFGGGGYGAAGFDGPAYGGAGRGGESPYGPGSIEQEFGGPATIGPIGPQPVVVSGRTRVLLRGVPREELVVGGIVRESRPFRVVGLAVDRDPEPGDPEGVRIPVLAPYERYDDVAAHAEEYMRQIKN